MVSPRHLSLVHSPLFAYSSLRFPAKNIVGNILWTAVVRSCIHTFFSISVAVSIVSSLIYNGFKHLMLLICLRCLSFYSFLGLFGCGTFCRPTAIRNVFSRMQDSRCMCVVLIAQADHSRKKIHAMHTVGNIFLQRTNRKIWQTIFQIKVFASVHFIHTEYVLQTYGIMRNETQQFRMVIVCVLLSSSCCGVSCKMRWERLEKLYFTFRLYPRTFLCVYPYILYLLLLCVHHFFNFWMID